MTQKHFKILLLFLIFIPCLYLVYASTVVLPSISSEPAPITKNILQVNDLSSSTYDGDGLVHKVAAQRITIRPKKVGIFRFRNVNEIIIDKLVIEQVLQARGRSTKDSSPGILATIEGSLPQSSSAGASPFGRIAGGYINQFQFKSWTANKYLLLDCRADSGRINSEKKQLELKNIVLYNPKYKRTISAKKGVWNATKKRFEIVGEYRASSAQGKAVGKGIAIDLYYHLENI